MAVINQLSRGTVSVGDLATTGDGDGKVLKSLVNSIANTDTAAKNLGVIPAGATLVRISLNYGTASSAATSSSISVGKSGGTGTEYVNAFDVKANAAGQYFPTATPDAGVLSAAVTVTGIFAFVGSGAKGGPYWVAIDYVTV